VAWMVLVGVGGGGGGWLGGGWVWGRKQASKHSRPSQAHMHRLRVSLGGAAGRVDRGRALRVAPPPPFPLQAVFDLLGIPLVHGWLVDPLDADTAAAVGTRSYNELMVQVGAVGGSGGGWGGGGGGEGLRVCGWHTSMLGSVDEHVCLSARPGALCAGCSW
jgi:hypothetical protein